MQFYDEAWIVGNEDATKATYHEAGAPYDTARESVWNARASHQYASGTMTRQEARWSMLNALREEINAQHGKSLLPLPEPLWCGEEVGTLRVEGLNILNDATPNGTVPWIAKGYRLFDTFCLHLYGIQPFARSLDYPAHLGYGVVAIGTTMHAGSGHPATLDPRVNTDLYAKLADCAAIARARQIRLWAYACNDCGPSSGSRPVLNLPEAEQHAHWNRVCEVLAGGWHIPSVSNEPGNGNSADPAGFPVPPGVPVWTRGSGGEPVTASFPRGPVIEYENVRDAVFKQLETSASVASFHNCESEGQHFNAPLVQVENIGFADVAVPGRRSADPALAAFFGGVTGLTRRWGGAGYLHHSDAGRLGQTPTLNSPQDRAARAAIVALRNGFHA